MVVVVVVVMVLVAIILVVLMYPSLALSRAGRGHARDRPVDRRREPRIRRRYSRGTGGMPVGVARLKRGLMC